jgi:ClpP class serine protease
MNETLGQIFITGLNASQGIPISMTTTTTTNWTQLIISLAVSSIFLLWMLGQSFSGGLSEIFGKLKLRSLKRLTGRHIIFIKHTTSDLFSSSMINQDTLSKIQKALLKFKGKPFDLVLHTPGGEIFSALYISRLIKSYPQPVRAIVPGYAMSGGTLLSLSCSEIYMGNTACLGPVDPQLGSLFKFGSAKSWNHIVKFKGKKADDSSISMALMGKQYTDSMRKHIEKIVDFDLSPKNKKSFIEFITSGEVEHAFALTKEQLSIFGLKVKDIPTRIQNTLLKLILKKGMEGVTYC